MHKKKFTENVTIGLQKKQLSARQRAGVYYTWAVKTNTSLS